MRRRDLAPAGRRPAVVATTFALRPMSAAISCAVLALGAGSVGHVEAAPTGGQVVGGVAKIEQPNAQTTIVNQATQRAALNWQSFSIGAGEKVQFNQPSSSAVALNRVVGGTESQIYGSLQANGHVFLINPSGVTFGRGANVNVGALVASTLDVGIDDFMAGRYVFSGGGSGKVQVLEDAKITAAQGGYVALIGNHVATAKGTNIAAPGGVVALAAGESVTLDFNGDGLLNLKVNAAAAGARIDHGGIIHADGGQVLLTARAKTALASTAMNVDGIITARGLVERNGRIVLDGGSNITQVSGTLDASSTVAGQKGGEIRVLGEYVGLFGNAKLDASGMAGGGTVLVGGDYQGKNPDVANAFRTYVGPSAQIKADAIAAGDGGKVIVWSDDATQFYGSISSRGGAQSGNGGFVEVSGKRGLSFSGTVDVTAPRGVAGTLLLDPLNILVVAGAGPDDGEVTPDDTVDFADRNGESLQIGATTINGIAGNVTLQAKNNVEVAGGGAINKVTGDLVLQAGNTVTVNDTITLTAGGLLLSANDPGANPPTGSGTVVVNQAVNAVGITITNNGSSGVLNLGANVNAGANPVTLSGGSGGISQTGGAITASTLTANATGQVTLARPGNAFTNLGPSSGSSIIVVDNSSLTVTGAVNAGTGSLSLSTNGDMTVNAGSTLSGSSVSLNAAGNISLNAAAGGTSTGAISLLADSDASGAGTLTTAGAGTIGNAGAGLITLQGADVSLGAAVTGANVTLRPSTTAATIGVNQAGASFNVDSAEIGQVTTTGLLTIGATANTGGITVGTDGAVNAGSINVELVTAGTLTVDAANGISTTGTLTLTADNMTLGGGGVAGSSVTLRPTTQGQAIDLGGPDAAGTLGLTSAEINTVTASGGTLAIGRDEAGNAAGDMTVTAGIAPTGATTLVLRTGGSITQTAGSTITENNLVLVAGTGGITLTDAGNNVGTLAATVTAAGAGISYTDTDALTIGTAGPLSGITTNGGAVSVAAGTSLLIDQPIVTTPTATNTAGGAAFLTAGTTISSTATTGTITTTGSNSVAAGTDTAGAGGEVLLYSTGTGAITLAAAITASGGASVQAADTGGRGGVVTIRAADGNITVPDITADGGAPGGGTQGIGGTIQLRSEGANRTIGQQAGTGLRARGGDDGSIAASLKVSSAGAVTLNEGTNNDVGFLAASVTGNGAGFSYRDANALFIETVTSAGTGNAAMGPMSGITTNGGAVAVDAGGLMPLFQPIATTPTAANTAGGSVFLTAAGFTGNTSGTITTTGSNSVAAGADTAGAGGEVLLHSTSAAFSLTVPAAIAASGGASVEAGDTGGAGGVVTLRTNSSNIVINANVTADGGAPGGGTAGAGGTIQLTAGNTISQSAGAGLRARGGTAGTNDGSLKVTSAGAVTLTGASNDVGTLAANVTGANAAFSYTDATALTIGSVAAAGTGNANTATLTGVTTNGGALAVTSSTGGLTVSNDVAAGTGALTLTASGANSLLTNNANLASSTSVTLEADQMTLGGKIATTVAGAAKVPTVILRPTTNGQLISLGGADAAGTLGLTQAEFDTINATTLTVGRANAGNLTVDSNIDLVTPAKIDNLFLFTGGSITGTADLSVSGLALQAASVNLSNPAGNIITLAANVTTAGQAFVYSEAGATGVVVGQIDTLTGITTSNGNVSITTGGSLDVNRPIAAGSANVELKAGTTINQANTGPITANGLRVESSGTTTLLAANNVTTFSALATGAGDINFNDPNGFTIGTVGSQSGISTGGNVNLGAPGGAIGQTAAGTITAAELDIGSGGGATLTAAGNNVNILSADIGGGALSYTDSNDLTAGVTAFAAAVGQTNAIQSNNGNVTLTANTGTLTIANPIAAGTGTVSLNATAGAIAQSTAAGITAQTLTGSAGTTAAFTATNNAITNLGTFNSGGALSLSNAGTLNVSGAVSAASVALNSGGSITQDPAGVINTAGALTGSATGSAIFDDANTIAALGPFTAGGNFTLNDTTGGLSLAGAVAAGPGAVSITTAGGVLAVGANNVSGVGGVTLQSDVGVTSAAGSVISTTAAANSGAASGAVQITAGTGAIILGGSISTKGANNNAGGSGGAGGNVTLTTANGRVAVTDIDVSGGDASAGNGGGGNAGTIAFNPGAGNQVVLNGTVTTRGGDASGTGNAGSATSLDFTAPTTVGGIATINARRGTGAGGATSGDVTFSNTLQGETPGIGDLTVATDGATSFNGVVGNAQPLASITTDAPGTTAISGGSITTAGAQTYNDPVTLGANATLTSVLGADITFAAALQGAGSSLVVNTGGATIFGGVVGAGAGALLSLTTDAPGTTAFNGGTVRTTGAQTYNDAVTLGANATATSTTAGALTFANTVNGPFALAANTAGVTTFAGTVGETAPLASLTTDAPGTTALNGGAVTTTGNQTYGDAVSLGANNTLASSGGTIAFGGPVNADLAANNRALVVNAPAGSVIFSGNVGTTQPLADLDVTAGPNTIVFNAAAAQTVNVSGQGGNTVTFNAPVVLAQNLTVTTDGVGEADNSVTFAGPVNADAFGNNRTLTVTSGVGTATFGAIGNTQELGGLNIASNQVVLNGNVGVTAGGVDFSNVVNLTFASGIAIDTDRGGGTGAAGNVIFGTATRVNPAAANAELTIDASADGGGAAGTVELGTIGDATPLSVVSITGDRVVFHGAVRANQVIVTANTVETPTGRIVAARAFSGTGETNAALTLRGLTTPGLFGTQTDPIQIDAPGLFVVIPNTPNTLPFVFLAGDPGRRPVYEFAGDRSHRLVFYNGTLPDSPADRAAQGAIFQTLRTLLDELSNAGFAKENIRRQLLQGLVLETGLARPGVDEFTADGITQPASCSPNPANPLICQ